MDLSAYKGLIFDMDGTLIDSMPAHIQAWRQTCEMYEIPFDEEWIYSLGGMPSIKTAQQINHRYRQNFDTQRLANTKYHFFDQIEFKGDVIRSTYDLLQEHRESKKVAVGTGSASLNAVPLLESTGILPMLDALVTADNVERHKPFPDTFIEAARRIGLQPEECVVFEDTELGKQAALAAGMDCIMVVDGTITSLTKAAR